MEIAEKLLNEAEILQKLPLTKLYKGDLAFVKCLPVLGGAVSLVNEWRLPQVHYIQQTAETIVLSQVSGRSLLK